MDNTELQQQKSNKQQILIIDDDAFLLNMYARKFDHAGYTVMTADSGIKALAKLKEGFAADVLMVDIMMPEMDGLTFVKEIRKQQLAPRAKVVMLTNQSSYSDIKAATEYGIDGYIIKAVTIPSEVVTKLREIVSGKKVFADPF